MAVKKNRVIIVVDRKINPENGGIMKKIMLVVLLLVGAGYIKAKVLK
jgi:hypothetical protein